MIRSVFVRCFPVAAGALLLARGAGAATPGLLPTQSGDSALYRYDVDGPHPSLGQVWVVRSNATRISVTVSPNEDAPGSFSYDVGANGQVQAAASESSVEASAVAIEMARNFASALNLLATVAATAPRENWSLEVPAPGEGSAIKLNARITTGAGNERTAVADGTGTITLPAGPPDKRGRVTVLLADVVIHVEALLQTGRFATARGVVKVTSREKQPKITQYTWTLALNGR